MREGHGADRRAISLPGSALPDAESDAVLVGDLLWIGGQLAADDNGAVTPPDAESQLNHIFRRIGAVCEEADTRLSSLLRIRAFVRDEETGYAFYAKLKELVPQAPPAASVVVVPDPLHVPECTVSVDAIAYMA
jgi:enamine deaminase RidA (YjgF/YER057c/UK114 family)